MASIGFPASVRKGRIIKDPKHLGKGWVGFNFARALGVPIRVINDAAMQALGSYGGGRMLFLGLGTGLGSALVWDKTLMSLELGDLPYPDGHVIENYLGVPGLALLREKKMETRSDLRGRAIKAIVHCGLRCARWRRQCQTLRQIPGRC